MSKLDRYMLHYMYVCIIHEFIIYSHLNNKFQFKIELNYVQSKKEVFDSWGFIL